MSMTHEHRERFDAILEEVLEQVPQRVHDLLEEVPLIVDDRPALELAQQLAADFGEECDEEFIQSLCGLHTGIALTERSVQDHAELPEDIRIFREGIVTTAGGWDQPEADDIIFEEIWITVLHEVGHHFGLDEDDLEELGYD